MQSSTSDSESKNELESSSSDEQQPSINRYHGASAERVEELLELTLFELKKVQEKNDKILQRVILLEEKALEMPSKMQKDPIVNEKLWQVTIPILT